MCTGKSKNIRARCMQKRLQPVPANLRPSGAAARARTAYTARGVRGADLTRRALARRVAQVPRRLPGTSSLRAGQCMLTTTQLEAARRKFSRGSERVAGADGAAGAVGVDLTCTLRAFRDARRRIRSPVLPRPAAAPCTLATHLQADALPKCKRGRESAATEAGEGGADGVRPTMGIPVVHPVARARTTSTETTTRNPDRDIKLPSQDVAVFLKCRRGLDVACLEVTRDGAAGAAPIGTRRVIAAATVPRTEIRRPAAARCTPAPLLRARADRKRSIPLVLVATALGAAGVLGAELTSTAAAREGAPRQTPRAAAKLRTAEPCTQRPSRQEAALQRTSTGTIIV
mmetsp:Transcript_13159/g.43367  ORF Transcript_13159/g.43367 Transcript_13159/m.43367 type:complete len:344 (-) Transcript_13159:5445-6476(-)